MAQHTDVFISSTKDDLIEYREIAIKACQRLGLFPIAMEDFLSDPKGGVEFCKAELDKAEAFIGIYAHRYGWQPFGAESITEMEYQWAVEKGIPIYAFVVDDNIPWLPKWIDSGDPAERLKKFKGHVKGHIVRFFTDKMEDFREDMFLTAGKIRDVHKPEPGADIHYVSDIPKPPEAYIAHPYTLMHASRLFGRREELNLLTDWVAAPSSAAYQARIMNVVAIGGMGKSALTWHWFNEIAPHEMKPLAGRLWWSFYESDAHFENFIIRALAYVTGRHHDEIRRETKPGEREDILLRELDQKPYLLVLDGLERILIAYARMDAARLSDDDYDKEAANYVAGIHGLPEGAGEQFVGQIQLRKTADPRAGNFLRKLAGVRASRILVSTRLYPAELQDPDTREAIIGCYYLPLEGLSDNDAIDLWQTLKISGERDDLLRVFNRFGNYPLLIRALAGEINGYRPAPGNFDRWREKHADFTPILMRLQQKDAKSHVLSYALNGLSDAHRAVLNTLAAFRAPAGYETLTALMIKGVSVSQKSTEDEMVEKIGKILHLEANPIPAIRRLFGDDPWTDEQIQGLIRYINDKLQEREINLKNDTRPFSSESHLDVALNELEQRGLIGWNRLGNRYDLHPIVRGVIWGTLRDGDRREVYEGLRSHFESVPTPKWDYVTTLDDLTPAIELYQSLIGLQRYDEAIQLFDDRLEVATMHRLSASRQRAELLEMLFPDGLDQLPRLTQPLWQGWTLNGLALAYLGNNRPGSAVPPIKLALKLTEEEKNLSDVSTCLCNLSVALRHTGKLYEAEVAARRAIVISREQSEEHHEAVSLHAWGLAQITRGADFASSYASFRRSVRIFAEQNNQQYEGVVITHLAQMMLLWGNFDPAHKFADQAWELGHIYRVERDFIRSARLQGTVALGRGDFDTASERLHHTLMRARAVNFAEEELPALVALAELARRQNNPDEARRLLDDVWEAAERAPYPLIHADALNVLAQIERDAGNRDAAVAAATKAYQKAWCDGPPFAYHWGLEKAKAHLDALGAAYPTMPPFDESKYEPMPEVEIDPPKDAAG